MEYGTGREERRWSNQSERERRILNVGLLIYQKPILLTECYRLYGYMFPVGSVIIIRPTSNPDYKSK